MQEEIRRYGDNLRGRGRALVEIERITTSPVLAPTRISTGNANRQIEPDSKQMVRRRRARHESGPAVRTDSLLVCGVLGESCSAGLPRHGGLQKFVNCRFIVVIKKRPLAPSSQEFRPRISVKKAAISPGFFLQLRDLASKIAFWPPALSRSSLP
jgi:hypothetical protein